MKKSIVLFILFYIFFSQAYAQKIVRVGAFNYYPAIFQDSDGNIKGFYVDALNEIAEKENIQFEYIYGSWNDGLEKLITGEVDMLTSVAFTEKRSKIMDYCKTPLLTVWGEVYVKPDSELNGILDLKGKKVAIMESDINGQNLLDLVLRLEIECTFIKTHDFDDVFKFVTSGKADAGVVNNTFGAPKQVEYGLRSTGIVLNPFDIYFTVKKNKNVELLNILNKYMNQWKHDRNSIYNVARQNWSHGELGKVEIIPEWILKIFYAILILVVILIVFISLLRHKVTLATEKVIKSRNNWQATFDAIGDIVILFSADQKIVEINKAGVTALNADKKDILDKNCMELVNSKLYPLSVCPCQNSDIEESIIKEYNHKNKTFQSISYPVFNNKGVVENITYIIKDITESKNAENKVREQKHLFETMFNTIEDGVVVADKERNIVLANNGMFKTFGYNPNELIGKKTKILYYDHKKFDEAGEKIFNQSANVSKEEYITYYKDKHNRVFPGETFGSKLYDNKGEWIGNIGIIKDISERVKFIEDLQQAKLKAEESDKLKSEFLANMSHEIRTPMNAIKGFAQLLLDKNIQREKQKKFLTIINQRTDDLLVIIDDIIDISKIEANQLNIIETEFSLNELMLEIYSSKESEISNNPSQKLDFKLELGFENEQSYIISDQSRLKQILLNLLNNALKFTSKGFIHFGYYENEEHELEFFVKDSGIGIAKESQELIFERFRQVDGSHTRRYGGTGLGLNICKQILLLMNGKIWLRSEEGKGSTFFFTVPLKFGEKKVSLKTENINYNWEGYNVLIVEDDAVNLYYLCELLHPTNINILKAEEGTKALELISSDQNIDLVLLDINLPGLSGNEIMNKIRQLNQNIPVIAQSAYSMQDEIKESMEYGFKEYVTKPIDSKLLLSMINRYLPK